METVHRGDRFGMDRFGVKEEVTSERESILIVEGQNPLQGYVTRMLFYEEAS